MAISALPAPTPAGVVADACALVGGLAETLWSARGSDELVGTVETLQTLRAELAAVEAQVLAEIDARQVAKRELGWASTADWYTHLAGLRRGDGKRRVDHARQLVSQRPATLAALREGTVSPEQAAVVLDAVDALPTSPTSAAAPNTCCSRKPAGSTPPTSPGPDAASSTSSTPTTPTAPSNGSSTARNAPPTTTATSRSPPTAPAASA